MPIKFLTLPPQARLLELFSYDPKTGLLRRKTTRGPARAGTVVGCKDPKRLVVKVDQQNYAVHRVIWKMITGRDPVEQIDHRNNDPHDNRWNNLREADNFENTANARRRDGKLKGVIQRPYGFAARIQVRKRYVHLGVFKTAEEAHTAYIAAAKLHFGHFSNSG